MSTQTSKNLLSNLKAKIYPFNGKATNLIDQFLILGYDQLYLEKEYLNEMKELIKKKQSALLKERYIDLKIKERPFIMNDIPYDYNIEKIDTKILREILFPDIKLLIVYKPNDENIQEPNMYNVIFSLSPQNEQNSKTTCNGIGYIFYNKFEIQNVNNIKGKFFCFYPIAFCIISEFPYFYSFLLLCQEIKKHLFYESSGIPTEIFIYNTIKYTPSPIGKGVRLYFGGILNENLTGEQIKRTSIKSMHNVSNLNISNNSIYSNNNNNNNNNEKKKKQYKGMNEIYFHELSGYPLIDFNLSVLFNLVPTDIIVELFIFTFLEQDIYFFSQNIEILNTIMYIFSMLSYPLNDSIYYWNILSLSFEDGFINGNSKFSGATYTSMIGINSSYPGLNNTSFSQKVNQGFIFDIDNKTFNFVYKELTTDLKNISDLDDYIKSVIRSEGKDNNNFFALNIYNLYNELENITKKVTNLNYTMFQQNPGFFKMTKNAEMIYSQNKKIQLVFYNFIITLLKKLCNNLYLEEINIDSSSNKSFVINVKNEENEIKKNIKNKDEKFWKIFSELFKDTSKQSSYIINFLQYHDSLDIYKIPMLFTDEILYWGHHFPKIFRETILFDLIDYFFLKGKGQIIDENNKKEKNKDNNNNNNNNDNENEEEDNDLEVGSIQEYLNYYDENCRNIINREMYESKLFKKTSKTVRKLYKYLRKKNELDMNILKNYIYLLKNLFYKNKEDNIIKYFPFSEKININNDNYFQPKDISDSVERFLIDKNFFSSYNLLKFSLFNLYAITLEKTNGEESQINIVILTSFSSLTKTFLRKYMIIICSILYRIYNDKNNNEYLNSFNELSDYIKDNTLIPNEELLKILNEFQNSDEYPKIEICYEDDFQILNASSGTNSINNLNRISNISNVKMINLKTDLKKKEKNKLVKLSGKSKLNDIITKTDNVGYSGELGKIKLKSSKDKNEYELLSPKKIFIETSEILKIYFDNLNLDVLNKKKNELKNILLSFIFYIENIKVEVWFDDNKVNNTESTKCKYLIVEIINILYNIFNKID